MTTPNNQSQDDQGQSPGQGQDQVTTYTMAQVREMVAAERAAWDAANPAPSTSPAGDISDAQAAEIAALKAQVAKQAEDMQRLAQRPEGQTAGAGDGQQAKPDMPKRTLKIDDPALLARIEAEVKESIEAGKDYNIAWKHPHPWEVANT